MVTKKDSDVSVAVENGVLTATVRGFEPLRFEPLADMPRAAVEEAAIDRFRNAWVDSAALSAGAALAEKFEALSAKRERWLETGAFRSVGTGGGGTENFLVPAIMEFQSVDRTEAQRLVGLMDKKLQRTLRDSDELRPIIDRIRAERARAAIPAGFSAGDALRALMLRPIGGQEPEPAPVPAPPSKELFPPGVARMLDISSAMSRQEPEPSVPEPEPEKSGKRNKRHA